MCMAAKGFCEQFISCAQPVFFYALELDPIEALSLCTILSLPTFRQAPLGIDWSTEVAFNAPRTLRSRPGGSTLTRQLSKVSIAR